MFNSDQKNKKNFTMQWNPKDLNREKVVLLKSSIIKDQDIILKDKMVRKKSIPDVFANELSKMTLLRNA